MGGGTRSKDLLDIAKELWGYLIHNHYSLITHYSPQIIVEYLPSALNYQADWESRNYFLDWKSDQKFFSQTLKVQGAPQIDRFASRLNHQLPNYMPQQPDLGNCAVDWRNLCDAFLPFCLIVKIFAKARKKITHLLIITPPRQIQQWFAALSSMSVTYSILLPKLKTFLCYPQDHTHLLVANGQLQLVTQKVSGGL